MKSVKLFFIRFRINFTYRMGVRKVDIVGEEVGWYGVFEGFLGDFKVVVKVEGEGDGGRVERERGGRREGEFRL